MLQAMNEYRGAYVIPSIVMAGGWCFIRMNRIESVHATRHHGQKKCNKVTGRSCEECKFRSLHNHCVKRAH
jgi:hypothetical protein